MNKKLLFSLCAAFLAFAATAQDKNEAIAAYNEGATKMKANQNTEAIAAFEHAISIAEEVGDDAADVRKNAQTAIISLRKKTASVLFSQKKYDEALKAMEAARADAQKYKNEKEITTINRALPTLYSAMGNEDMNLNKYAEAVNNYKKGIALNANMSKLQLGLGAAYQKLDSAEQALASFDKAIEIAMRTNQPADAVDARRLAKSILMKSGQDAKDAEDFKKAYECFNTAVKYDENDPDVRLQVAIVANRSAQAQEAIAAGEKALELEKRDNMKAKIYYQLGYAYEQAGNAAKACANYKKVPAGDSDKTNADGAIKRLKCQ
jgi:tetratricopeptide (TPR) repeat protein